MTQNGTKTVLNLILRFCFLSKITAGRVAESIGKVLLAVNGT